MVGGREGRDKSSGHCHSERSRGISRETPLRAPTFSPRDVSTPLRCAQHDNEGGEVPASARAEARERRGMGHWHSERSRGISRETPRRAPTFSPRDVSTPLRCAEHDNEGARFLPPRALKRGNDGAWGIVIPSGAEESFGRRPVVRQPSHREMFRLRCAALNMTTRGRGSCLRQPSHREMFRLRCAALNMTTRGARFLPPPTLSPRDVSTPLRCAQHDNEGGEVPASANPLTERCFDSAALRST